MPDMSALSAPSTFVKVDKMGSAQIPIANFSPHPCIIQPGEVLGVAWDPHSWLDEPSLRKKVEAKKMVVLLDNLSQNGEKAEPFPDKDEEDELLGPKMAEVPESVTLPSSNLASVLDISPNAPPEIQHRISELIRKHQSAFSCDDRLGNPVVEVKINMEPGTHLISLPMYRASSQKREVIDTQINKWLEQEVIEPSKSPWAAPVIIVYWNREPRFCVDYCKLNSVTIPDKFPIPWQSEILQALSGAQVLTTLDTLARFNQLSIAEEDQEKTGFRSHQGLHQFKQLPFGLHNGPSVFQRVMQGILAPFLWIFSLVYIDDIVVYPRSYEEHLTHLDQVL